MKQQAKNIRRSGGNLRKIKLKPDTDQICI